MSRVDLGFLEKTDAWLLKSNYFPSKVGGKPSWLNLKELPSTEELLCKKCNKLMIFLCQIYAPMEEKDYCFHRTIFVFICRTESCCIKNDSSNLLVWRNQLKRENDFYPAEPPVEDSTIIFDIGIKTCEVCGILASKHCSKCKITAYCSREHQVADWKTRHKSICGSNDRVHKNHEILFEEWELIIETELKQESESVEDAEKRRLKEYEDLLAKNEIGSLADIAETDLESHAAVDPDKVFTRFKKRIADNPDQVLRYNRGGEPLWIADNPKPNVIPNCEFCNSPRQFEFQILPQLLYSLKEDILDWGSLIIYTCINSCNTGPAYKQEFIFKQDIEDK